MTRPHTDKLEPLTVVVFAKEPEPGEVKTRLADDIGEERAAALFECFLQDTAATVGALDGPLGRPVSAVLAYSGDPDAEGFAAFRERNFTFIEQQGDDLGERLAQVSRECFDRGAHQLIIVGTDSPTLGSGHFMKAVNAMGDHDVVVGPSFDGGYYMIGLDGPHPEIFEEIDWSTARVYEQTLQRCHASSLLCETLEFWYDVDTISDLKLLKTHLFEHLRHRQPKTANRTADCIAAMSEEGIFDRGGDAAT